jgi:hypothetical protein
MQRQGQHSAVAMDQHKRSEKESPHSLHGPSRNLAGEDESLESEFEALQSDGKYKSVDAEVDDQ